MSDQTDHKMVVCYNGHQITYLADLNTETTGYCEDCGAKLISNCSSCKEIIPGETTIDDFPYITMPLSVPKYCKYCGRPYPWTEATIKAANEMISLSELTDTDKEEFEATIPDLMNDTPRTQLAITKFKLFIAKVAPVVGNGLRDILVDVISETAKKAIWGS